MGDAAGIGPELCVRLLNLGQWAEDSIPLVIGSARILERVARKLELPLKAERFKSRPAKISGPSIWDVPEALARRDVTPGRTDAACGRASARFIEEAVRGCQAGVFAGLVTAPISKHALHLAGFEYPGHTELLAHLTGSTRCAMLLYSETLAIGFVTSHQSLQSVPAALRPERIILVATLLNRYLKLLRGVRMPRLAILGLNPHGGEAGLFGKEEELVIAPAVQRLRALGLDAEGPVVPDAAFTPQALKRYVGHVAQYHDQGCIPFKMACFDTGVNVTMGLGLIRTSPDHGTAFDVAWQGVARPDSFFSAYALAARLAAARERAGRRTSCRVSASEAAGEAGV